MLRLFDDFRPVVATEVAFLNRGKGINVPDVQSAIEKVYSEINRTSPTLEILSVKDFGAKGDGQTDDAPAVQALIDYVVSQGGGVIYFPPGNYLFKKGVTVSGSNVQLEFAKNAIILFESQRVDDAAIAFSGSEGTPVKVTKTIEKGATEIEVEYIPPGLKVGDWVKIRSDELFDTSRSYYFKNEYLLVEGIEGNTITLRSPTILGYSIDGYTPTLEKPTLLENVGISGARIESNTDVRLRGISFSYCFGASVSDCYLNNPRRSGVEISHSIFVRVIDNYIHIPTDEDDLNYGVDVLNSQYVVVSNNTIISKRTAIDLNRLTLFSVVIGNSVEGAINSHAAAYVIFADNTIRDGGIYIRGPHTTVSGNKVYVRRSRQWGIATAGAAEENINIENNEIFFPNGAAESLTDGISHRQDNFRGVTIRGNKIFGARRGIVLAQGSDNTPGSDIIIEGNRIVLGYPTASSTRGISISRNHNAIVKGNLIINPSESDINGIGIEAWATGGTFTNHIIDSNMIIGPFNKGVEVTNHYTNVIVTNNIVDGAQTPYNITSPSAVIANNHPTIEE